MFQVKLIVFIVASAGMVWLSRSCLSSVRSHGFYRFFAWEAILALLLLNLDYWLLEPLCIRQIASWMLLSVCSYLVIDGVRSLHTLGKPDRSRSDPALIGIEKTTELVTTGVYKYIRHPIYGSLLFLTWGTFLKDPSITGSIIALFASLFLTITARVEEAENIAYFGARYQDYMTRTTMFVPYLF